MKDNGDSINTVKAPAETMKMPSCAASIKYSGQCRLRDSATDRRFSGRALTALPGCIEVVLAAPLQEVIADPQRIGHGRERGIHRSYAAEETRVHDIQVIQFMCLAVSVQY